MGVEAIKLIVEGLILCVFVHEFFATIREVIRGAKHE